MRWKEMRPARRRHLAARCLAAPIVDTVKRESANGLETVDRAGLWRALTPQVFAYAQLRQALEDAAGAGAGRHR